MKKLLLIPVVILLLTGCNKPAETQNVEQPETQQVVTPEEQPEDAMEENTEILYNEDGSIDTSNWKTYTNEEYGFSVKYPESFLYGPGDRATLGSANLGHYNEEGVFTNNYDEARTASFTKINQKNGQAVHIAFVMNDLGSEKKSWADRTFSNFKKEILIGGKVGRMFSPGPEDIGMSYVEELGFVEITKETKLVTQDLLKKSEFVHYSNFVEDASCDDIYFRINFKEYEALNKNGVTDPRSNELQVVCKNGVKESDGQILKAIFENITFSENTSF